MIVGAVALVAAGAFGAVGNMIGNQAQNEGLSVVPAKASPTIDGIFSPGEWDFSGRIWSFADWDVKEQFSVRTACMWDRDYLYMAFDWRDPLPLNSKINPLDDPGHGWMADAVQLRVKTARSLAWITMWGYDGGKRPAFDIVLAGNGERFERGGATKVPDIHKFLYPNKSGVTDLGEGVQLAYRLAADGKGFTQELRMPWTMLYNEETHAAKAGDDFRMGVEFYWGDQTGRGRPYHSYKDNLQPGISEREFFWTATHVWGDVKLEKGSVPERIYTPQTQKPVGTIKVRARVPADREFFTVAIEDAQGNRVRNLAGGYRVADFAVRRSRGDCPTDVTVEIDWDGCDDLGRIVPPGTYRTRTLGSNRIDGYYEMCFYDPGTPPWYTADTKGAWGADHCPVSTLGAAGEAIVCCSSFAEGGYGTFALGPDGRKLWSDKRGSSVVAGDAKYTFIVPSDWSNTGTQLCRIDTATGKYVPFTKDGEMPLALTKLFGLKVGEPPPRILGLARVPMGLLILSDDNILRVMDPETGAILRKFPLHATLYDAKLYQGLTASDRGNCPFAALGNYAYSFFGRELRRTDVVSGKTEFVPLTGGWFDHEPLVEKPLAMAVDATGEIYVADGGADSQVKVFSPEGKFLRRIGKSGGRNRVGPFDRSGVLAPKGLAVDAKGQIWIAEAQDYPRRISVWTRDGDFVRDYLGNLKYSGIGGIIHRTDPTKAVANYNEIRLDPKRGAWDVVNVMFNPDETKGYVIRPGESHFHSGDLHFSAASGEKREYFSSLGLASSAASFFLMIREGDRWVPVAAISSVGTIQHLRGGEHNRFVVNAPYGEWAGHDAADVVVWNDFNNDGYVQQNECEFIPAIRDTTPKNGRFQQFSWSEGFDVIDNGELDTDDLGFHCYVRDKSGKRELDRFGRMLPVRYRDGGKPVYSFKDGFHPLKNPNLCLRTEGNGVYKVPGKDLYVGFISMSNSVWVAGWKKSTDEILWKYPSPFHCVHGSHKAPMPKPGLVIGPLKIMGVVTGCGDKDVMMIRGNLGEDYFLTTDGLFVNRFTKDERLPGLIPPEDEALFKKVSYATLNGFGEHFSGIFCRQDDGVIRSTSSIGTKEGCSLVRMEGLDSLKAGSSDTFAVDAATLLRAEKANAERKLAEAKPAAPLVIGRDLKTAKAYPIKSEGQRVTGEFKAAYDAEKLQLRWTVKGDDSPWRNHGKDWRLLFKTGDCVDFQFSPTGNRGRDPVEGDCRIIVANFGDGPVAVKMRQVAKGASPDRAYVYNSPVMNLRFDSVEKLAAKPVVTVKGTTVTVALDVPWRELGANPNSKMTGDVGFILSDANGEINTARVYRSNKNTGLCKDQPGEAKLEPRGWCEIVFQLPEVGEIAETKFSKEIVMISADFNSARTDIERCVDRIAQGGVTHLMMNIDESKVKGASAAVKSSGAGLDQLAILISKCRERGVSPWLSFRVNGANARTLDFIRNALMCCDADGVEFDLQHLPSVPTKGGVRELAAAMTAFMREIRAVVEAAATQRGHAIVRAVRVLSWPVDSQQRGLEVDVWAKTGLIDAVIPGSAADDVDFGIPVGSWRNWIGKGVKLYPGAGTKRSVDGSCRRLRYEEYLDWAARLRERQVDGFCLFDFSEQSEAMFERVVKFGLKPIPVPPVKEVFEQRVFTNATGKTLNYRWMGPTRPEKKRCYPLVLLLHGAGERGTDNTAQLIHGVQQLYAYSVQHDLGAYFIVPQVPCGKRWVEVPWDNREHAFSETPSETMGLTLALVDQTLATQPIDRSRVYVTGLSMGGYGSWDALTRRPDLFAGAIVNCGGGDAKAAGRIGKVPIWVWHGTSDDAVPVSRSREMVKALKAAGGNVRYTELYGVGHGVWFKAYESTDALEWLFSQTR